MKFTAQQIAEILSGEFVGDAMAEVNSLAKIEDGKKSLAFNVTLETKDKTIRDNDNNQISN